MITDTNSTFNSPC